MAGEIPWLTVTGAGKTPRSVPRRRLALLPGAFNPLHRGHLQMAQLAAQRLGRPVHFELSVNNVDKSDVTAARLVVRVAQFSDEQVIWLTRAATFSEKARVFPASTFIIGADTALRIADPRYYGGDRGRLRANVARLVAAGCRFLIFGRIANGAFRTLEALELLPELREICTAVPELEFRVDVSSTELRREGGEAN